MRANALAAAASSLAFAVAAASSRAPTDERSPLSPVQLRCDGMVDPLGVDSAPPRLSWQLAGEGSRGLRQGAWRVLVSTSLDRLAAGTGDLWDSGRVESDEQIHVPFGGRPLRAAEQAFWKVRVWDGDGRASAWSAPATGRRPRSRRIGARADGSPTRTSCDGSGARWATAPGTRPRPTP